MPLTTDRHFYSALWNFVLVKIFILFQISNCKTKRLQKSATENATVALGSGLGNIGEKLLILAVLLTDWGQ